MKIFVVVTEGSEGYSNLERAFVYYDQALNYLSSIDESSNPVIEEAELEND
jgi:hypothetical protein